MPNLDTKYLYLLLNTLTIVPTLVLSFDKKVAYYKRWKYLFPAMAVMASLFIVWDVWFTSIEVWGFNPRYLSGIDIINLPLEEWLFFITIPYASVFIYDCMKAYFPSLNPYGSGIKIAYILSLVLLVIGLVHFDKWYTSITFISLSALLLILARREVPYLGRFFISYLIVLVPFFVVNGILTGSWIQDQVVWYDNTNNLTIRLGTIPLEDIFYGMLLILGNVMIYEWGLSKKGKNFIHVKDQLKSNV
jgi:lycopene cyclase domain-containing protein